MLASDGKSCMKISKKCKKYEILDADSKTCIKDKQCPTGKVLGNDGKSCFSIKRSSRHCQKKGLNLW